MSTSNSDSVSSNANDSSLISSSSQLNSDLLLTPPKNSSGFKTSLQQQQQDPSNSLLFFSDQMPTNNMTPMGLSTIQLQNQQLSQQQQRQQQSVPPFLQDNSLLLRTGTPELDIDIALGDLNLDDYHDFLSQGLEFSQKENRSMLNFGSMTPNPQSFQQGFNNPTTPNWAPTTITMPQSAPPFNHSGLNHSNSMLLNIKSFKLPDEETEMNTTTTSSDTSQQQHQQKFGGSLLSSSSTPPIGGQQMSNDTRRRSNESRATDEQQQQQQQQQQQKLHQNMQLYSQAMMMGPPPPQGFVIPYGATDGFNGSVPHPPSQFLHTYAPPPQLQSQQQLNGGVSQMWDNHGVDYNNGYMMGGNITPVMGQMNENNLHNQHHHPRQQQQQQQQQHLNQRWNNNGVNVHRNKMNNNNNNNNNRRKGEDPSKYANTKLEDFKGEIYSLCKDQHGCRFLQKQLEFDDLRKTSLIFDETYSHVIELMIDPFGNYLIQKLLEKCNDQQRTMLVKNASPEFLKISINPHGTRALQKLIECVSTEEESLIIVKSLKPYIVTLSKDLNGNHVVQKCLAKLSQESNQFIFDICCRNCVEIATHRHGCCVLQRCLDYGSLTQCKQLGYVLSENVLPLSFDPFGNYVIQYILNNGELIESNDESITKILTKIHSNFIDLSLHKFGSNVIEKILRLPKVNSDLIDLILNELSIEDFNKLLNDSYGNYVLQTCLDVSNFDKFEKLKKILIPILPSVKNTPHGRRISARLGINLSTLNNGSSGVKENIAPLTNTLTIAKVET